MQAVYNNVLLIKLSKDFNLYFDNPVTNIADGAKGRFGEIDNTPAFKGAAIIDLDHYTLAIGEVGDPHHGAEGQFHMGGAIEVVAIDLAASSLFAVIAVSIIAGIAGFAIAAPAAAVTLVITAATGRQQQAKR